MGYKLANISILIKIYDEIIRSTTKSSHQCIRTNNLMDEGVARKDIGICCFGEPIDLAHYGPEAADDHVLVGRLAEQVRSTIQEMVDRGVARRKSVWLG